MNDILLQQGRAEYQPLLDFAEGLHRAYAERHRIEYLRYDGPVAAGWPGFWDQIALLRALFGAGARRIYWLDADALLVGDDDLREALGDYDVAMCRHPGPPEHWNIGVSLWANSTPMRHLLRAALERGPGAWPWYQQAIVNELLAGECAGLQVGRLDDRWNATVVLGHLATVADPVIVAWHGIRDVAEKLAGMRGYVEAHNDAERG